MYLIKKTFNSLLITLCLLTFSAVSCGGGGNSGSNKKKSDESRLNNIILSGATLDSEFTSSGMSYGAELDESSSYCTVGYEKKEDSQSVTIEGFSQSSYVVLLYNEESKTISIKVTAEDGISESTYSITIRKKTETSKNAYLKNLFLESGYNLNTTFIKTTYNYSAQVESNVNYLTIYFEADNSNSTIKFNGEPTTASSKTVSINDGVNTVKIKVTSEDGSETKTYTISISKGNVIDSKLSNLVISSGTLTPAFDIDVENYTATISVESVYFIPTAVNSGASITVDGTSISSGSQSQAISFSQGETKNIVILVSGSEDSTTYKVTVTRQKGSEPGNAYLDNLTTTAGTISFNKYKFGYDNITVENSISSIQVTATAEDDESAIIKINGNSATSGVAKSISLNEGIDNLIEVSVVDGTNSHSYMFVVTRKGVTTGYTPPSGINIYFQPPTSWSGVPNVHYNDGSGWTSETGEAMDAVTGYSGWYTKNFPSATQVELLFNDGTWNNKFEPWGAAGTNYIITENTWVYNDKVHDTNSPFTGTQWIAPVKPVITFDPDGGMISSGDSVSITAETETGTITSSGYLVEGVKHTNLSSIVITSETNIIAFAENSNGGAIVTENKNFTIYNGQPIVSVNPTEGEFTDTIYVNVDVDYEDTKEYSIDNGTWQTLNSETLTLGADKIIGEQVILRVRATNSVDTVEVGPYYYSKVEQKEAEFSWDNATVYFVMTDRFYNGDTSNDHSYGRECTKSGSPISGYESKIGTFHGGDLKGLTEKLVDGYFDDLGINAIWITAPYEQIHGALSSDGFKHYAYHGYYTLDYSNMDENMGTEADLKTFIDTAHSHGIRVIFDIVLNHVGYATPKDANEYGFGGLTSNWKTIYYDWNESQYQWYNDYEGEASSRGSEGMMVVNADWSTNWWGTSWVRMVGSRFSGYSGTEGDGIETCVKGLPDLKTETTNDPGLPGILKVKWAKEGRYTKEVQELNDYFSSTGRSRRVTTYVGKWLTDWVREYGVDGFRCDTAKHINQSEWKTLKEMASEALVEWRKNNPTSPGADWTDDFWMTGEHWDWSLDINHSYFSNGFDSMINFGFQYVCGGVGSGLEETYSFYAKTINSSANNVLSYISSHDKGLSRGDMINKGTALLLCPGAVQIFYGDETNRPAGSGSGDQPSRSQMNWSTIDQSVLTHWQRVGNFRKNHIAVGAGAHNKISSSPYTFSRIKDDDKVVICLKGGSGTVSVNVSGVFSDGTSVKNAYDDTVKKVSNGTVSFSGDVILIEKTN